MENQKCSVCQKLKTFDNFHKNKNRKNGLSVTCKTCSIQRTRRWEKENKDKVNEKSRKKYHKNLEKSRKDRRIRVRKWYSNNSKKSIAATKSWNMRNPHSKRISEQKRRSAKISRGVFKISKKEILKIISSPCVACGSYDKITMDHIVPLSRGGKHSIGNLQPLCFSCNASKNNRVMTEWILSKGGN